MAKLAKFLSPRRKSVPAYERVPRWLQVGLTGKSIDPGVYFAIGVCGAPNHTCRLKRAQTVMAINNDPEAMIFERANIGFLGDWRTLLPPLLDALERLLA